MATIGLNAQLLNLSGSYRGAGIHRYIHQLLTSLPEIAPQHRYLAYLNERRMTSPGAPMHMRYTRWPAQRPAVRILWEQTALPLATFGDQLDLLHALAFAGPWLSRCPVVLTIYDMSFALMPERFPPLRRRYLHAVTRWSAQRAACITVISQSTKDDVVRFCGVPPERVRVIYCGVDEQFRPIGRAEVERFRTAKGLPSHFILFLGTLEPRKNIVQLVRAYAALRGNGVERPRLILGGAQGWGYAEIQAAIAQSGVAADITLAGYIAAAELPLWYNAADLFVYPSVYEGFGLPVAEAMACGTPAITSNVSSLPEVAGDAALMVTPGDTGALSAALSDALHDAALRTQMRERGLKQAARFQWRQAALETAQAYAEVLVNTR